MARLVAQHLSESLGQSFFVENLTGASGVVGTTTAANASGDGHTILFVTNDFAVARPSRARSATTRSRALRR